VILGASAGKGSVVVKNLTGTVTIAEFVILNGLKAIDLDFERSDRLYNNFSIWSVRLQ
jgi:hypothetical protein